MESAKRASVGNNCVASEFFFFFKKRRKGKEVKKQSKKSSRKKCSHHQKQQKVQFRKKNFSNEFFFSFTRVNALLRFQTHTHACFKRVNNNNNAGVHNLFPVV